MWARPGRPRTAQPCPLACGGFARRGRFALAPGARSSDRARGHTLPGLLIASALGLFVIAGALTLYRTQRAMLEQAADAAAMREAGANALALIEHHLAMAGYRPADWLADAAGVEPAVYGCGAGGNARERRGSMPSCRASGRGSDGIVVRYVGDAASTWPTEHGETTDCLGQAVGAAGQQAIVENRFYVERFRATGEPHLYCAGNTRPGQPVVAGIERLVIRYWLRGDAEPRVAEQVADGEWRDVVGVGLCVVSRGRASMKRSAYVDCAGQRAAGPDALPRMALHRYVPLRNRVGAY